MRIFEPGDIVIVRENSLQVTDDIMGYVVYTNKKPDINELGQYINDQIINWSHIVTEKGEILRGVKPEGLVHVTKSHYIYFYKQNDQALNNWVDTGIFQRIIDAMGTEVPEIDDFIIINHRKGWWNIH